MKNILTNISTNEKGLNIVNKLKVNVKKTIKIEKSMITSAEFAISYTTGKVLDRVLG